MRPLYIDYSGADAPKWAPFAKKKMQQYQDYLTRVGLESGRKQLVFDGVEISFSITPHFSRLRIQTSAAVSFALYLVSSGGNYYATVGAFDSDAGLRWKHEFAPHSTSETINRALVGCNADATRVIVAESDDDTYVSIHEISQAGIVSTVTYTLAANERFVLGSYYRSSTASTDGSRAMIGGVYTVDGSEMVTQVGALFYCRGAVEEIQLVSVGLITPVAYLPSAGVPHKIGGSYDLSTAYLWPSADVGSTFAFKKITVPEGANPTVSVADDAAVPSGGAHAYAWSLPDFAIDGSYAVGYVYVGSPDGSSLCDITARVLTSTGYDIVVKSEADSVVDGLYTNALYSVDVFCVHSEAEVLAYAARDIKINTPTDSVRVTYYGVLRGGVADPCAKGDVVKAVSSDGDYMLVFQYTDVSLSAIDVEVRSPLATVSLSGLARYDTPYPYAYSQNYYQITTEAVVRDSRGFLMQPNAGSFGVGPQPSATTVRWAPSFEEETGTLVSYGSTETVADGVPANITRTISEVEVTMTRVPPSLSKYNAVYGRS